MADWSRAERFAVNSDLNLNRVDPANVLKGIATLRRTLKTFRPDLLNPHCPPGHAFLAMASELEAQRIPLVRTAGEPRPPRRNVFNRWLHERRADAIILTTDSSRARYRSAFNLDGVVTWTIHPGFRADDFTAGVRPGNLREQFGIADGQILAGIVARMSPEKGQEVLLHALQKLEPEYLRRLHVVLAGGDSRERSARDLELLADRLGVRRHLTFLGNLDDVRPLLSELDVGIITSTRSEAICRIALEYMSFGVPIIASDVNILPEVVRDGENGWIFHNHDAAGLARQLRAAIDQSGERQRRGQRGYELVHNDFSATRATGAIVAVFDAALERRERE